MKSLYTIVFTLFLASCTKTVILKPEVKDLVDAVYASGTVMPDHYYRISASYDGNLDQILVKEGDVVKKSQTLLIIDPEMYDWKNNAAASVYQQARLNAGESSPVLMELESGLRTLTLKYKQDSLNFDRFSKLWAVNAVSKVDFEKAELAAKSSYNEYKAARERFVKTKQQLQVELKNAESNYLVSSKDQEDHRVKSVAEGKVFELYKEQGELIRRGEALALLGDANSYVLEIWIDEEDLALIKKGQEVLVTSDVYGDSVFNAVVTDIFPSLNTQRQAVKVEAKFMNTTTTFPANCNIEANIIVNRISKALVIPKMLLTIGDSVLLSTPEGQVKRKVVTGIDQGEYVQIISGLTATDELIVPKRGKK